MLPSLTLPTPGAQQQKQGFLDIKTLRPKRDLPCIILLYQSRYGSDLDRFVNVDMAEVMTVLLV